jgi:hypothetical protein
LREERLRALVLKPAAFTLGDPVTTETTYRIRGLTKIDRKQLEKEPSIQFIEEPTPAGTHGELVTLSAVVTVSAISALAAFLLKKHRRESFEELIEEIGSDGSVKRRVVKWSKESSEAPDAAIIKQIRGSL